MNMIKSIAVALVVIGLSACAGPQFPETGQATPFDGMWTADLSSQRSVCSDITSKFEVRYGMLIGTVSEKGRRIASIWGQILPNGQLDGNIGKAGISGASANVQFTPTDGTGTWKSKQCEGSVQAKKNG